MSDLKQIFKNNIDWVNSIRAENKDFFKSLVEQQQPDYLWIGCSDSRVPANQLMGLMPGDVFVHRNVANMVVHADFNTLAVIHYAVEYLKVKHIIVCGHYGCGGVGAAMADQELGLIDNWLRHIQDIRNIHRDRLMAIEDMTARANRLCELNVMEQVSNVCRTTIVRDAWRRGQSLAVHGWIYALTDGRLKDLNMCVNSHDELEAAYATTLRQVDDSSVG